MGRQAGYDPHEDSYREMLLQMQTELRLTLGWGNVASARKDSLERSVMDSKVGLNVLDWLLRRILHWQALAAGLESISTEAVRSGAFLQVAIHLRNAWRKRSRNSRRNSRQAAHVQVSTSAKPGAASTGVIRSRAMPTEKPSGG